jgi:lipoprotein-anchoring transpeptidase ErfK/SrfK
MNQQPAKRVPTAIAVLLGILVGMLIFYAWQKSRTSSADAEVQTVSSEEAENPPAADTPPAPQDAPQTPTSPLATAEEIIEPAVSLLREAEALRAEGRLQAAREKALDALDQSPDPATRAALETLLGEVGIALVMTPRPMPEKIDYVVEPGNSLARIARRYGTTVELLKKSNGLRSDVIRPGDRLRVFTGTWSIRVNKTRNDLVLSLNNRFFKRYRVGTGEFAKTPTGEFKIVDRIAQPTWWHPDGRVIPYGDPENLLGTHWLALDVKGYGIHGTWEPETVGRQASLGCVRLLNEDIEELFTLVPVGTPVIIEE